MLGLDNWIYSANHTTRFRNLDGNWEREPTAFRGQWGISQDDFWPHLPQLKQRSASGGFDPFAIPLSQPLFSRHCRSECADRKGYGGLAHSPESWSQSGISKKVNFRPDGTLATFTAGVRSLRLPWR